MKKLLQSACFLLLGLLAFTACAKEKMPYDRYLAAQEILFQSNSVTINWTETDLITNLNQNKNANSKEELSKNYISITAEYAKNEKQLVFTEKAITETENIITGEKIHNNSNGYFQNNLYYQKNDGGGVHFAMPQEPNYAEKHLASLIFQYPKSAIASQSSEITADGELITVIFDNEKIYAHLYPEIYQELGYGKSITYEEPFTFEIQLDAEGKLISLHGTVYIVSQTDNGYRNKRDFIIEYSKYNETIPDFSDFHPEDYEIYPAE